MSEQIYTGSCHCQRVRFQARIDLTAGTVRCNCSLCSKSRHWSALVAPAAFDLLAGADALGVYRFGSMTGEHLFCRYCGIHPFSRGHAEALGGDYVAVCVNCLDGVEPAQLLAGAISFCDGRNDDWATTPAETGHL